MDKYEREPIGVPGGGPTKVGRFATGLVSFRYTVWTCLSSHSERRLGGVKNIVAAGINPAARATPAGIPGLEANAVSLPDWGG